MHISSFNDLQVKLYDEFERYLDDCKDYTHLYITCGDYRCNDLIGVKVYQNGILINSALIGVSSGGRTSISGSSSIIEEDRLVLCCSNTICCLSVPEMKMLWQTEADTATCFQIFKYEEDYIVHGEMDISRLDKNGVIIWQASGEDIFVMQDDGEGFTMKEDHIYAKDFCGKEYKIGYDGKCI